MNQTATDKGTDLLAFLKATATLRRRRFSSYGDRDTVIWFGDVPTGHAECRSPFLMESAEDLGELWLEVRKKRVPVRPPVPETVVDWVRADELDRTESDPDLHPEITVLVEVEQDRLEFGSPPEMRPELRRLDDYPEVEEAWLEYLVDQWEPWAKGMRRWQEVQNIYEKLDFMRRRLEEAEERYELLLAVGLLEWRDPMDTPVRRHLLTAPAEIVLDAARGLLSVVPAASFERFRIELDMLDLQHQPSLDAEAIESRLDELDIEAWNTFRLAPVLRELANRLRSDAQVDEEGLIPAERAEERPRVSYAPALVLRERRPTGYDDLIRSFLESAAGGGLEATRPWNFLLREGETPEGVAVDLECGRDHDAPGQGIPDRFLFPRPANDEQREIVHRLQHNPCVLVKGPPGTGKSHTIANLICHLLAMGDRILVTAQAPKALAVLGTLLPADIRDLSVTALGSTREDQRLLEESVRGILRRKTEWLGPAHDRYAIDGTEKHLLALESELAKAERFLRDSREAETHPHTLPGGYQGTAAQIARSLDERRGQLGWLPGLDKPESPFPLDETETALLAEMHPQLDEEALAELRLDVGTALLPGPDRFKTLIATLTAAEESAARATGTAVPQKVEALAQSPSASLHALRSTLVDLENLAAKATRVLGGLTETILADLLAGSVDPWNRLALESDALLREATALLRQLGTTRVELPSGVPPDHLRTDAQQRLAHFRQGGRRGFGIVAPRVVKETAHIEKSCLVDGRRPDSVERLASVVAYLDLDRNIQELARLWPDAVPALPSWRQAVARARDLTTELRALLEFFDSKRVTTIAASLPGERTSLALPDERNQWVGAVAAELANRAAQGARADLEEVLEAIRECGNGAAHPCLAAMSEAVKTRDFNGYCTARDERERIREQKERLARYDALLEKLDRSCPGLAKLLRSTAGDSDWTERIRAMNQAWAWSSAHAWLRQVSDAAAGEERVREHHRLQRRIENATEELVSIRAWGAFFERLDQPTVHSLNAWTKAVGRIGKGTGRYAYRHRRTARRYLMDCVPRIPAWVMPLHRLWDMVDAEPGLFGTVIVDEASQASGDALALLLLAKRIIVVGDDKQNSPEAVGVPEDSIARLAREHLKQFRFRDEFRPDTSLFDHAQRSFEHPITLREHFRCVPEIIRFSNDLCYRDAPLIALRQAPPNRLPAMESRFVAEGACEGKGARILNRAEAAAVVEEIEKVIDDEDYTGKSFGVIALQGSAQAHLIEHELAKRLDPETMEAHRLRCGGPAAFQGDERDIVFLSLVAAPNVRHRALTTLPDQRRFNVAMSRARDQVRLFHSVRQHDLGPDDLRRKLIAFFENPLHGAFARQSEDLDRLEREARSRRLKGNQPDPYESWFEVDVALELLRRKFAVHPQAEVAGYRIDLVVEGNDARLAVECDGDAWHGAERYERDMARQRQLERAGWTFVRIRESAWYTDREAAIESVVDACEGLGIRSLEVLEDTRSSIGGVAESRRVDLCSSQSVLHEDSSTSLSEAGRRLVDLGGLEDTTSSSRLSPETVRSLVVATTKAVVHWALKGYRAVGQMIAQIRADVGEERWRLMRPYFATVYEDMRDTYEDEPWVSEMTPENEVEAAMAVADATHSGVDPEMVRLAAEATYDQIRLLVYDGMRAVERVVAALREKFGDDVYREHMKGHVRAAWENARQEFADEPWVGEMSAKQGLRTRIQEASDEMTPEHDVMREMREAIAGAEAAAGFAPTPEAPTAEPTPTDPTVHEDGAPAHAAGRNRSQVWDVDESVEADTMKLQWNTRYEASKPRLVDRLEALMRISDEGELPHAERTISAIRNLPEVGEYGGSVRIENRVARRPGDSDFIYSLFVSDEGFELSYHERLPMEGGQRDYTDGMTLVNCNPVGCDSDDESLDEDEDEDEEALANMRESVEMMAGSPFSDEEWQMQVEAAREMEEIDLPNGIDRWLGMLPVDDEGKCPETVSVEWNG